MLLMFIFCNEALQTNKHMPTEYPPERWLPRRSKFLQHHYQRWCKVLQTGVNLLL